MIIQLDFTEQEMIRFLQDIEYQCYKESRQFEHDSILKHEQQEYSKQVVIVIDHYADEIMVPDEKDFRMKSSVLKETFTKEFKRHLLKIHNKSY